MPLILSGGYDSRSQLIRAKYYDALRLFADEGLELFTGIPVSDMEAMIYESVQRERSAQSGGATLEAMLKYFGALWRKDSTLIPAVLEALRLLIFDKRVGVQSSALLEFAALAESPDTSQIAQDGRLVMASIMILKFPEFAQPRPLVKAFSEVAFRESVRLLKKLNSLQKEENQEDEEKGEE